MASLRTRSSITALASLLTLPSLASLAPLPARSPAAAGTPRETVVLVHGLNRTSRSLWAMARALRRAGYDVIACDYPSRAADVSTLSASLFAELEPRLSAAPRVHFVTHSLGGVLLRVRLLEHPLPNLGRVVMLAPPSCGSELVDRLGALALVRRFNGPAGLQLGTGASSLPRRLPRPSFEFGVIAGDRTLNPLFSWLIPGPDDGKVSVASTRTEGMRDFRCLHATHTWMMWNPQVIRETLHFLKHGAFRADRAEAKGGSA